MPLLTRPEIYSNTTTAALKGQTRLTEGRYIAVSLGGISHIGFRSQGDELKTENGWPRGWPLTAGNERRFIVSGPDDYFTYNLGAGAALYVMRYAGIEEIIP